MLTRSRDAPRTGSAAGCSVLVVDDEPFNIDLLCQELEELGHRPIPAEDGQEALRLIETDGCDLMLLDIMMPRMNGIQVLEHLRAAGRLAELPVIVVSALDDIASIARCIELGAEDHLVKPFDPTLLQARIGGALEKKSLREQVARQLAATRALFGRYVPSPVAEDILAGAGTLDPVQRTATVLYCDIVGFTGIVQDMAPDQALTLLNAYFATVIEPVRQAGGVINEFVGDGMLITFNLPVADGAHADNAVLAATGIQAALAGQRFAGRQLDVRIGIHSGPVIAGNVAAGDQLHYTVLGDTVNVAARLEETNKIYGTAILISGDTAQMLQNEYKLERLEDANVRGKDAPLVVYSPARGAV